MNYSQRLPLLLFFLLSISNTVVADKSLASSTVIQTPSTEIPISRTIELQTLEKQWGLEQEEYQHYLGLMRGPLGKWNPDLDPLLALGMFAKSPQQERKRSF